jgi:endonuclease/exonuclease/phosphatase family metal-dependent hydrolase/regulation of enolase protein 1 (concanavalin A-like superfamily)
MLVSPGKGLAFQRRRSTGGTSTNTAGAPAAAPYWVKLTRTGSTFTAAESVDGQTWTTVGSDTIPMPMTIYVGVAIGSHRYGTTAAATFGSTAVASALFDAGAPGAGVVPAGWATSDIGNVGPAVGAAVGTLGALDVTGGGADVWGTADAFRFAYTRLTGDGSIVTRVASEEDVAAWTKAGVMMRESLNADARHAFMFVSPGKGLAFQRRRSTGGTSSNTPGASATAPYWVRLTRAGSTFTASESTDGTHWTTVGSDTISMASTIYVGLALTSHDDGVLAAASFASTAVTSTASEPDDGESGTVAGDETGTVSGSGTLTSPPPAMPSGWATADIGAVGATGAASGTTDALDVAGAGDVWGAADAFRFAYTALTGDGSVVTQVLSEQHVADWTKAGVMMRESLSAGSRQAFMLVSAGKGLAFQRREATGGESTNTYGGSGSAPYWVRLTRIGDTFSAYKSVDGATWTKVGSDTIPMASTIYVGVAVSSHVYGTLASARFDAAQVSTDTATATGTDPAPSSSTTLRVLQWNTHHGGIGTDGKYNPARLASWIAKIDPQIVSLNEVDTAAEVTAILTPLESYTGVTWTASFSGKGNVALSRLPVTATDKCVYPDGVRYSAHLQTTVNGLAINLWSTHTTVDSASARLAEVKQLQGCASEWPEARILAGDFNMQYGSTEYKQAASTYTDAWLAAKAIGATTNYAGNCDGCTRNSRIDYIFSSHGATFLTVKSAQIFDTRDANGVMPSDHKPMLVIYNVN